MIFYILISYFFVIGILFVNWGGVKEDYEGLEMSEQVRTLYLPAITLCLFAPITLILIAVILLTVPAKRL